MTRSCRFFHRVAAFNLDASVDLANSFSRAVCEEERNSARVFRDSVAMSSPCLNYTVSSRRDTLLRRHSRDCFPLCAVHLTRRTRRNSDIGKYLNTSTNRRRRTNWKRKWPSILCYFLSFVSLFFFFSPRKLFIPALN